MKDAGIPIRHTAWHVMAAAGLLLVATCGCAATPGHDAPATPVAPHIQAALNQATIDTGLPLNQLEVVDAKPVTWRDSSLGCPEADLMYTQALVPGYRITIRAAGKTLDYHADQRGRVLLCPAGRAQAPASPPASGS